MESEDTDLVELARKLGVLAQARGLHVTTAESCTGGWVAKAITDVPGSSAWFGFGFVTYSNAAKQRLLQVPADLLAAHGAVSEAVVRAMAEGALVAAGADIAVAISGVAGPGGGTPEKPVGRVWFAVATVRATTAESGQFAGDRDAVRRASTRRALKRLIAEITG